MNHLLARGSVWSPTDRTLDAAEIVIWLLLAALVCFGAIFWASSAEANDRSTAAISNESPSPAVTGDTAATWSRWEKALRSTKSYPNPCADVTLRVSYRGPKGQSIDGYGFWDGGDTFRVRFMFPIAGTWTWRTACSDSSNEGLHNQSGTVHVSPYAGANVLYRRGYLKVSEDKRYLTYGDRAPFLWIGDTAWQAPVGATQQEWETYVRDRAAKQFTVLHMSARTHPEIRGAGRDTDGNRPFLDGGIAKWNPAFWQNFERKVQYANDQGLVVLVVGICSPFPPKIFPGKETPAEADARRFARNLAARLMGNYVIFSPGFDEDEFGGVTEERITQAGEEIQKTTPVHLLTNHPNPDEPGKFYSERYYDQSFVDFAGLQSGRGKPDPPSAERCAQMLIQRCLALYGRNPWKPLVNLEARYDSPYNQAELARLPRSCGYWSFLSGAAGYSYGCRPVWTWGNPFFTPKYDGPTWTWSEGMNAPSSTEVKHLSEYLSGIEWWRLTPDHGVIRKQSSQWTQRMVFARSAARDLAVAYLPDNDEIQLDLSRFPTPMKGRWFDPRNGTHSHLQETLDNAGVATIRRPASGDWVLTLTPAIDPQERKVICLPLAAENLDRQQADSTPLASAQARGFSTGRDMAAHFGVHEVVLTGDGSVTNPFDTVATVTFTPPSGEARAKTVHAFHDGDNIWRARVYVSETGDWNWTSACKTDQRLDGKRGTFKAGASKLRGRLLIHPKNPRQWITEDGRWFLNLNDTAYFLLCSHDGRGGPVPWEDFTAYVRDAVAHGVTSFRSWVANGPRSFLAGNSDRHRWHDLFADDALTRLNLDHLQTADRKLRWLLDNYPDVYVQFILFPLGTPWRTDESFWAKIDATQKERMMRYLIARFAAYPSVFWLIVNDAHYAPDKLSSNNGDVAGALKAAKYPNNIALAREAGAYFKKHDPWQHPLSTGHARTVPFQFGAEDWATYIHLENQYDLGARAYEPYHQFAKPVFLGEDRYEQDRPDRDPADMRYYQRRLFWAWLLSGGSANYGGRWWAVHPYAQTGKRETPSPWHKGVTHKEQLVGLDSVRFIRDYFAERKIELADFEPDHGLVSDLDGRKDGQAPKLMRRGTAEYLVYHPNAASDGKTAKADTGKAARFQINLKAASGTFRVEWYRADDGKVHDGGTVEGGNQHDLTAPWKGSDVVVRLLNTKEPANLSAPPLARTASTILLLWERSPSRDVACYEVYRDGTRIGSSRRLSYTATGLPAGTASVFTVRARDVRGAVSGDSGPVTAATRPAGRVFNVRDHGAKGDGLARDTVAIQHAIAACTPGGTVLIPPGTYSVDHLELKGDLTLELAGGAVLQFLGRGEGSYPQTTVSLPGPDGDVPVNCGALVTALRAANVTITGRGTIRANGESWWPHAKEFRPFVLEFLQCTNIFVQGITIEDPPCWNTHPLYVDRAVFSEVKFLKASKAGGSNGDGLNPDSCRDVLIVGCEFGNQDDSIAVKAGKVSAAQPRRQRPCENIVIRDCRFDASLAPGAHPLGFAVGSETCGGIRHVTLRDCEFRNVASIANIKSNRDRAGAVVEDIRVENCVYANTVHPDRGYNHAPISIDLFYYDDRPPDEAAPLTPATPVFRDIHFKNIVIENPKGWFAYLCGLVEQPARGITLENVVGTAKRGFHCRNIEGIELRNVGVEAREGPPFEWINVKNRKQLP